MSTINDQQTPSHQPPAKAPALTQWCGVPRRGRHRIAVHPRPSQCAARHVNLGRPAAAGCTGGGGAAEDSGPNSAAGEHRLPAPAPTPRRLTMTLSVRVTRERKHTAVRKRFGNARVRRKALLARELLSPLDSCICPYAPGATPHKTPASCAVYGAALAPRPTA